jgi:hypothetical protein
MLLKKYAFFIVALCAYSFALAQQPANEWCGTRGKSPWLKQFQLNKLHQHHLTPDNGADTAWLYVPTTVHIVGTNSGTGYYALDQALRAVCEMNGQYESARIRFYLMPGDGVRYLNNTTWYDHDWEGGAELIESNKIPERLNCFIVQDPAGNCGYSWYDAIVMGKNCSGPGNSTWAHEAGHHLSLPHPFYGWEGHSWDYTQAAPEEWDGYPVEKMDGSNCYNSADGFCDTEPDYLNYRWTCNNEARSNQLQHDPNGVSFRSDASLIMGYSYDECSTRFTPEQIEAMRANLRDEHSAYLQITEPLADIPDDMVVNLVSPIDSALTQFNNINLRWNAVPNATYYTVEVGMNDNFQPRLFYKTIIGDTTVKITTGILNNRVMRFKVSAYSEWDLCQPNDNQQIGYFTTRNLSATNELEASVSAELAPNPVMEGQDAILNLDVDRNMNMLLNLTDAAGRLCYQQEIRLSDGENRVEIPTTNLGAGIYILTLQNEKGTLTKRLAVSR